MGTQIKSDIINRITECVAKNKDMFELFDNIYLFGSVLNCDRQPNDIDILLIYSKFSTNLIANLNIINYKFCQMCDLPIDLSVLSSEEEKNTGLLNRIGTYLKLK